MKIIVSLTTTYQREQSGLLSKSIQSLINQDLRPDKLLLNISEESYLNDSGFPGLPGWLKNLEVTVNWVENTGPYRKLLPALAHAENKDLVVTADDDVVYQKYWLKNLITAYKKNPGAVACCRARKMKKNICGQWQNYRNWPLLKKQTIGGRVLATGCGGVVYTKALLDLDFLYDRKYLEIAPTTDDLWFKMAGMRKQTLTQVFPGIDRDNVYLAHDLGLDKANFTKVRTNSRLKKFFRRTGIKAKNYLGINHTRNDTAWDEICSYSEMA